MKRDICVWMSLLDFFCCSSLYSSAGCFFSTYITSACVCPALSGTATKKKVCSLSDLLLLVLILSFSVCFLFWFFCALGWKRKSGERNVEIFSSFSFFEIYQVFAFGYSLLSFLVDCVKSRIYNNSCFFLILFCCFFPYFMCMYISIHRARRHRNT